MGRIQGAYEQKFRRLLAQIGAHRIEEGIRRLTRKAETVSEQSEIPFERALETVHRQLRSQIDQYSTRVGKPSDATSPATPPKFVCDAGLGGLARWLRASGYEARWKPDITDDALIKDAQRDPAILLTTDSGIMERRLVRTGTIPAIWVSPSLRTSEQLSHVLEELKLPLLKARCMSCGGELVELPKETVADRIPPRTLRWL